MMACQTDLLAVGFEIFSEYFVSRLATSFEGKTLAPLRLERETGQWRKKGHSSTGAGPRGAKLNVREMRGSACFRLVKVEREYRNNMPSKNS